MDQDPYRGQQERLLNIRQNSLAELKYFNRVFPTNRDFFQASSACATEDEGFLGGEGNKPLYRQRQLRVDFIDFIASGGQNVSKTVRVASMLAYGDLFDAAPAQPDAIKQLIQQPRGERYHLQQSIGDISRVNHLFRLTGRMPNAENKSDYPDQLSLGAGSGIMEYFGVNTQTNLANLRLGRFSSRFMPGRRMVHTVDLSPQVAIKLPATVANVPVHNVIKADASKPLELAIDSPQSIGIVTAIRMAPELIPDAPKFISDLKKLINHPFDLLLTIGSGSNYQEWVARVRKIEEVVDTLKSFDNKYVLVKAAESFVDKRIKDPRFRNQLRHQFDYSPTTSNLWSLMATIE